MVRDSERLNSVLPLRHEVGERAGERWCLGLKEEIHDIASN